MCPGAAIRCSQRRAPPKSDLILCVLFRLLNTTKTYCLMLQTLMLRIFVQLIAHHVITFMIFIATEMALNFIQRSALSLRELSPLHIVLQGLESRLVFGR
jgi:hypothetical protein